MNAFSPFLDSRFATLIFLVACTFFCVVENASATVTIYPSNHPSANVVMNGFECSVDGQAGVVTIVPNYPGGEGCAVSSIIVYDSGSRSSLDMERESTNR
jgi:hypothetical protein